MLCWCSIYHKITVQWCWANMDAAVLLPHCCVNNDAPHPPTGVTHQRHVWLWGNMLKLRVSFRIIIFGISVTPFVHIVPWATQKTQIKDLNFNIFCSYPCVFWLNYFCLRAWGAVCLLHITVSSFSLKSCWTVCPDVCHLSRGRVLA